MKRLVDLFFSVPALIILSPLFILIAIWIKTDDPGPLFYRQARVGLKGKDFRIYKFRTMRTGSDKAGLITIGSRDPRVTHSGYLLRKYKLDELPQLLNVLGGSMSLVGPRPEVRKYVDLYTAEQMRVLDVKPGITDYASIEYSNESELLARAADPDKEYIETIMPAKLELNLKYIREKSLFTDLTIILKTIRKVFL
ncbi:MAG TPA: sugar transferase [Bacteroidia bacterium]|nr:sugar transferase [Bacteroidia bacterium]